MKELERLQGIRSGDDIPVPPENMEVDVDTNVTSEQDGFDSQIVLEFINDFVKRERVKNEHK